MREGENMNPLERMVESTYTYKAMKKMSEIKAADVLEKEKQIKTLQHRINAVESIADKLDAENDELRAIIGALFNSPYPIHIDDMDTKHITISDEDLRDGAKVDISIKQDAPKKGLRIYARRNH